MRFLKLQIPLILIAAAVCLARPAACPAAEGPAPQTAETPSKEGPPPHEINRKSLEAYQAVDDALEQWDPEGAAKLLDAIPDEKPMEDLRNYYRGAIAFQRGDYPEALRLLKKARDGGTLAGEDLAEYVAFVEGTAERAQGFIEKESEHFRVRVKPGKDEVLLEPLFDTLEKQFAVVGQDLGVHLKNKILVEIYPSSDDFIAVSGIPRKNVKTTHTIGLCKYNRLIVTSPRAAVFGYSWRDTAAHELVHYLVFKKSKNRCPIWLHEGTAHYEEGRWRGSPGGDLSPSQETLLQKAVKNDGLVPLKKMHPSFALLDSPEEGALAFAQVDTMIEYMVRRPGGKGMETLRRVMEELAGGANYQTAVAKATGEPFDKFYDDWLKYLKEDRKFRSVDEVEVAALRLTDGPEAMNAEEADEKEADEVKSEEARKFVRLGDMLRSRGRLEACRDELEKARGAAPESPVVLKKLARAYMAVGDWDKVLPPLRKVEENYPGDAPVYRNLGEYFYHEGNLGESVDYLRKSLDVNPFDYECRQLLFIVLKSLGREPEAAKQKKLIDIVLERKASQDKDKKEKG